MCMHIPNTLYEATFVKLASLSKKHSAAMWLLEQERVWIKMSQSPLHSYESHTGGAMIVKGKHKSCCVFANSSYRALEIRACLTERQYDGC